MLMGGISGKLAENGSVSVGLGSFVKTDEKAVLNILALSEQLAS